MATFVAKYVTLGSAHPDDFCTTNIMLWAHSVAKWLFKLGVCSEEHQTSTKGQWWPQEQHAYPKPQIPNLKNPQTLNHSQAVMPLGTPNLHQRRMVNPWATWKPQIPNSKPVQSQDTMPLETPNLHQRSMVTPGATWNIPNPNPTNPKPISGYNATRHTELSPNISGDSRRQIPNPAIIIKQTSRWFY